MRVCYRAVFVRLALCATALLPCACASEPYLARVPDNVLAKDQKVETGERKSHYPSGAVKCQYQCRIYPDGHSIKHGRELEYDPSGALVAERHYRDGQPIGNWTSWWPDGTKRMELLLRGPEQATTMSWWHANGALASQGPARDGLKDGLWKSWAPNGREIEEGEYRAGKREGLWRAWSEDGALVSEGRYARDHKVGEWKQWDEHGQLIRRGADEAPDSRPGGSAAGN